jgi:hypothetical protein
MIWQESGDMRLGITPVHGEKWALITQVRSEHGWEPAVMEVWWVLNASGRNLPLKPPVGSHGATHQELEH